ncbi:sugar transferase [Virgibacillus sp. 179-BFC.A HS]|uniref:Sugar transferase n=1 Tax=Tigheibacillus jepli TaxID=3035914 RepID=A0ABU5CKP1_9BACI|nr:sugar transferase [Virgibacillus sp. 179-BFC.A HS]MDY0406884.1 sugar transferase [Virgibacillus sp. 179-BFC.A HS]
MGVQQVYSQSYPSNSAPIEKPNSYFIMKRIVDITVSLALLILFAPLMIGISWILHKKESGPAIIKQMRMGKNKRPFMMYAFSTTTPASKVIYAFPPYQFTASWSGGVPNELELEQNRCLLTKTGKKLKKYHLDKLPQLWNVLKGDMSLVGPSPEYPDIASHYNDYQAYRLKVKPGITGYAQIHGISNKQHDKKIRFDLFYISNCSGRLDTKIVFRTFFSRKKQV